MKEKSIKNTIFLTVSISLLGLAVVLFITQGLFESKRSYKNTQELILEQIELVAAKLDIYSIENQKKYVAKTLFNLKQISSVQLFDRNCNSLNKRPINFNNNWDCKGTVSDKFVVYKSNSSLSDTDGAIKYILAEVNQSKLVILSWSALFMMFLTFLFLLMTLFVLNYFFNKRIMMPLDKLKELVGTSGAMSYSGNYNLPIELKPIFNDVVRRDEVIRQKNIEINNISKEGVRNKMRKEFAHNIKFPLTLIRDFILEEKSVKENKAAYLNALNDLEILSEKLSKEGLQTAQELNIVTLSEELISSKVTESKNHNGHIDIKLNYQDKNIKVYFEHVELRSILSNLINNSKESTEVGQKCLIEISIKLIDKNVVLKVKDNGSGISADLIKKVFKKGATFNKPGGSGVGLYHARKIINKYDGTINIESEKNTGTVVTINLPNVKSDYLFHGEKPFKNAMIEDYELSQSVWLEQAIKDNKSFIVFSSPSEFENNSDLIDQAASIYIDSNFPDTKIKGEDWSKKIYENGFKNLFMCTTKNINLDKYSWIKGIANKNKPFQLKNIN